IDTMKSGKTPDEPEDDALLAQMLPDLHIPSVGPKTGDVHPVVNHADFLFGDPAFNKIFLKKLGHHEHPVGTREHARFQPFSQAWEQLVLVVKSTVLIAGGSIDLEHHGHSAIPRRDQARELVQ